MSSGPGFVEVHPLRTRPPLSCTGMPSQDTTTPESAVRAYLQYLQDPTSVVDVAVVKKAQSAVERARDPIDRLKALGALERSQATDKAVYKDDFVKLARTWAQGEDVPVSAFR